MRGHPLSSAWVRPHVLTLLSSHKTRKGNLPTLLLWPTLTEPFRGGGSLGHLVVC